MRKHERPLFDRTHFYLAERFSISSDYKEVLKSFYCTVDEWYDKKRSKKKMIIPEPVIKIAGVAISKEWGKELERRNVWVSGDLLRIKLELFTDREAGTRSVIIKHGDIGTDNPIMQRKYFTVKTHRRTVKKFIADVLFDLQKTQPRI